MILRVVIFFIIEFGIRLFIVLFGCLGDFVSFYIAYNYDNCYRTRRGLYGWVPLSWCGWPSALYYYYKSTYITNMKNIITPFILDLEFDWEATCIGTSAALCSCPISSCPALARTLLFSICEVPIRVPFFVHYSFCLCMILRPLWIWDYVSFVVLIWFVTFVWVIVEFWLYLWGDTIVIYRTILSILYFMKWVANSSLLNSPRWGRKHSWPRYWFCCSWFKFWWDWIWMICMRMWFVHSYSLYWYYFF